MNCAFRELKWAGWLKRGEVEARRREGMLQGLDPSSSPAGDGEAGKRHHQCQEQAMRESDKIRQDRRQEDQVIRRGPW